MKTRTTLFRWGLMALLALTLAASTPLMAIPNQADTQAAVATVDKAQIVQFDKAAPATDTIAFRDGFLAAIQTNGSATFEAVTAQLGHIIAVNQATNCFTVKTNTLDSLITAMPTQAAAESVQMQQLDDAFHYHGRSALTQPSTTVLKSEYTAATALEKTATTALF